MKPLLTSLLAILVLSGCAPTRAYRGEALPPEKRSVVWFYDLMGIQLSSLSVDGVHQGFGMGIEVAPGRHEARLNFELKERECSFNSSWCGTRRFQGECLATFLTRAGINYRIEVSGIKQRAWITVLEESGRRPAGTGSCTLERVEYD